MEKGWKEVLVTAYEYKAEMAISILEKNGIKGVILNQKDSSYLAFGELAIYVEEHDEGKALELLKELKN
jgi:hypothetical protein